jgi:molybdopterin/thiamine biosynthesis adenylyltransferase
MITNDRYARLDAAPWLGPQRLAALQQKRVGIIGLGNIGGQLAQHLVMLGVHLSFVDKDVVETVNLGTQGFTEEHIGLAKTEARARWLGPLNPSCRIEPLIHADIRRLGLGEMRECDILFSCLDSRVARVTVNEVATRLGIPWVDAALDGTGQSMCVRLAAYDPRDPDCGCYLCPHDSASFRKMVNAETPEPGCSMKWWQAPERLDEPTFAISALGGAAASMQAIWGLKILLGTSDDVTGKEIYFDPDRGALSVHRLKRNPQCLFDHQVYALVPLGEGVRQVTVEQTFATAEKRIGEGVVLELLHRAVVTRLQCIDCGRTTKPLRTFESLGADDASCSCGGQMIRSMEHTLEKFTRSQAAEFLDRTWAEIGLPASEVVVAMNQTSELHLLIC